MQPRLLLAATMLVGSAPATAETIEYSDMAFIEFRMYGSLSGGFDAYSRIINGHSSGDASQLESCILPQGYSCAYVSFRSGYDVSPDYYENSDIRFSYFDPSGAYVTERFDFIADAPRNTGFYRSLTRTDGSYATFSQAIVGTQAQWTGVGFGVPEPSNWALMIAGIGLAGVALRRRRSAKEPLIS